MCIGCHSSAKIYTQTRFVLFCNWLIFNQLWILFPCSHWYSFNKPHTCSMPFFLSFFRMETSHHNCRLFLLLCVICFSLQEGKYLLGHKSGEAFLTIFKACDGKKPTRSIYDLQAVHCGPPVIPEAKIPWVPVDPYHLMPFHKKYCRPPCTFPPCPPPQFKV